jgi:hypothetical protein
MLISRINICFYRCTMPVLPVRRPLTKGSIISSKSLTLLNSSFQSSQEEPSNSFVAHSTKIGRSSCVIHPPSRIIVNKRRNVVSVHPHCVFNFYRECSHCNPPYILLFLCAPVSLLVKCATSHIRKSLTSGSVVVSFPPFHRSVTAFTAVCISMDSLSSGE